MDFPSPSITHTQFSQNRYSTRTVSDPYFKSKLNTLFQTVERYVSFKDDEWFRIRVKDRKQMSKKSETKLEDKKWQWLDQNAVWRDYDARTSTLLERSAEALSKYVETHMKSIPKTPRTMVEWGVSSVLSSVYLLDGRVCSFNLGTMKEKDLSSKKERMMRRVGPPGHAAAFLHYIEDQQNEVKSKQKHPSKIGIKAVP